MLVRHMPVVIGLLAVSGCGSKNGSERCRTVPTAILSDGEVTCSFERSDIAYVCTSVQEVQDSSGELGSATTVVAAYYPSVDAFIDEAKEVGLIRSNRLTVSIAGAEVTWPYFGTFPFWILGASARPVSERVTFDTDGRPTELLGKTVKAWDHLGRPTAVPAEVPCESYDHTFAYGVSPQGHGTIQDTGYWFDAHGIQPLGCRSLGQVYSFDTIANVQLAQFTDFVAICED